MAEMKGLKKLYDQYKSDSTIFIMITFENQKTINEIIERFNLDFKMVSVERNIIDSWLITRGYPTNIVLDKNGKIVYGKSGGMIDEEKSTNDLLNTFGPIIESSI